MKHFFKLCEKKYPKKCQTCGTEMEHRDWPKKISKKHKKATKTEKNRRTKKTSKNRRKLKQK